MENPASKQRDAMRRNKTSFRHKQHFHGDHPPAAAPPSPDYNTATLGRSGRVHHLSVFFFCSSVSSRVTPQKHVSLHSFGLPLFRIPARRSLGGWPCCSCGLFTFQKRGFRGRLAFRWKKTANRGHRRAFNGGRGPKHAVFLRKKKKKTGRFPIICRHLPHLLILIGVTKHLSYFPPSEKRLRTKDSIWLFYSRDENLNWSVFKSEKKIHAFILVTEIRLCHNSIF